MSYQLIINNSQLHNYCQKIQSIKAIALDSEFIRTRTFYPHLGLLQIFDGQHNALIDPLAITDWSIFISILQDTHCQKYFHACSEDLEVFLHHFNLVPQPIIDSQILASFLDNPLSAGYASLVSKYLNVDLDKSETRTDWLKRPLTEKQCQYAANDVFYLLPLIEILQAQLAEKGFLNLAYAECEQIINHKLEPTKPEDAYLNISHAWQLKGQELAYLQKLASWRVNLAKQEDIAVNFIIHSDVLWQLARHQPTSLSELSALGMKGKEIRLYGDSVLSILAAPCEAIEPIKRVNCYPDYKALSSKIKQAAEDISKQTGLSSGLLVSKRHINHYVQWIHGKKITPPELVTGWRAEFFKSYLPQ